MQFSADDVVATIHRMIRPEAVVQMSEDALQRISTEQPAEQKIEVLLKADKDGVRTAPFSDE